ncbi:hypothetical protein K7432_016845 [Basidiobolus ranarum]|uniref:Uncharacterized protein n=1 Tax=Basidiobolus ranarum TaxID=34480 RepID=A0ABR2WE63_9FUNG
MSSSNIKHSPVFLRLVPDNVEVQLPIDPVNEALRDGSLSIGKAELTFMRLVPEDGPQKSKISSADIDGTSGTETKLLHLQ